LATVSADLMLANNVKRDLEEKLSNVNIELRFAQGEIEKLETQLTSN
jgi:hypothetical protein